MDNAPWWRNTKGEWYVVVQVLLFMLVIFGPRTADGSSSWGGFGGALSLLIGLFLVVTGGLISAWALLILGRNLSALPHPLDDAVMVMTGPYKFVRHPIYSGIILAALGWGFIVQGYLTLLYGLVLFVFFDIKTRREERFLMKKFSQYASYRERVRKLIPYFY